MHYQLADRRNYHFFNVIDEYKRGGLTIEAGFSLHSFHVIRVLDLLLAWRNKLFAIRYDNGLSSLVPSIFKQNRRNKMVVAL